MPAAATSSSRADTSADGTRSTPAGPADTSPRSRPGDASVPRIGTGRVCGTAAGIAPRLIHSATSRRPRELDDGGRERPPAVVGLRADEDEQVPLAEPRPAHGTSSVPGQLGQAAVDDLERRPPGPIVEQHVGIERRATIAASSTRCSRALVAADPASTQPSNAATRIGAMRSPGSTRVYRLTGEA